MPRFVALTLAASGLLVLGGGLAWWRLRPAPKPRSVVVDIPYANARPGVAYAGDAACARCHAEIARTYSEHPMGRSLAPAAAGDAGPVDAAFDAGGFHYTVTQRDGRVVHRETRTDARNQVLADVAEEVAYVLGSGTRGRSYLVARGDALVQSPITWYSQAGRYDLAPGYQFGNAHFERPVGDQCLYCHTNRATPVPATINRYEPPMFLGHAIGCERCHGPGALHVQSGGATSAGRDKTIVNPASLGPELRDAVCEQCHLQGDSRIEPADRRLADYRPGLPLYRYVSVFFDAGKLDYHRAVGQVEQMHASRCYIASRGALSCIACHDPHERPAADRRTPFYRDRCLACHESRNPCSLPPDQRRAFSSRDSCIQCHMPPLSSSDIVHNAATDHRIPRLLAARPKEPAAVATAPALRLFHEEQIRTAEERAEARRARGIALAEAVVGLEDPRQRAAMARESFSLLADVVTAAPGDAAAVRAESFVLGRLGHRREALALLLSALKISPRHEGLLENATANALTLSRKDIALPLAQRLTSVNPSSAEHQSMLAQAHALLRQWPEAESAAREALRLNPAHPTARALLIDVYVRTRQPGRARREEATLRVLNAASEAENAR
jgi:tetratricopeptide (TPR) repeat protein